MRCPYCATEIDAAATACRSCGAVHEPGHHWSLPDGYGYAYQHWRSHHAVKRALVVVVVVLLAFLVVFGLQQANQEIERDACEEVADGAVAAVDC